MDDREQLLHLWRWAADDLGLELDAPFEVTLDSGVTLTPVLRLRNFGATMGMLLFTDYGPVAPHAAELTEAGFGFSVLPAPELDAPYEREGFIDVLADWTWSGTRSEIPQWLLDWRSVGGIPERYWRSTGPEDRARVAELAGIANEAWMQDWPLEVADPSRLGEFIKLLQGCTDTEMRCALMELVLYSLDGADDVVRSQHWPAVEAAIAASPTDYAYPLMQWSCLEERGDGSWAFSDAPEMRDSLTALTRPLLARCRDAIGFEELVL